MNIILSAQNEIFKKSLQDSLREIEEMLKEEVDSSKPAMIEDALARAKPFVGRIPQLTAISKLLYDTALSQVVQQIRDDEKLLNLKDNLQRKFIDGELSNFSALHEKTTATARALEKSIDILRSLLSYEKELIRNQQ